MLKKQRGITLIALVVTIIILLILAGVSISLIVGENGILNKAQKAKYNTEAAAKKELAEMDSLYNEIVANTDGHDEYKIEEFYIGDENANNYGLYLANIHEAQRFINLCKATLKDISKLGAIQNRLEHTIENLDNAVENLPVDENEMSNEGSEVLGEASDASDKMVVRVELDTTGESIEYDFDKKNIEIIQSKIEELANNFSYNGHKVLKNGAICHIVYGDYENREFTMNIPSYYQSRANYEMEMEIALTSNTVCVMGAKNTSEGLRSGGKVLSSRGDKLSVGDKISGLGGASMLAYCETTPYNAYINRLEIAEYFVSGVLEVMENGIEVKEKEIQIGIRGAEAIKKALDEKMLNYLNNVQVGSDRNQIGTNWPDSPLEPYGKSNLKFLQFCADELLSEIDRISNEAHYNKNQILNGNYTGINSLSTKSLGIKIDCTTSKESHQNSIDLVNVAISKVDAEIAKLREL